ncbi:hypothetical protein BRC93_03400 [Halobacteriales archaeon QS_5_70_15]|jgi:hypothetical protein|nr:MAG: hypothetical protein BRC93_03400 [Halobacteriales archaeon QS_5_70_15]
MAEAGRASRLGSLTVLFAAALAVLVAAVGAVAVAAELGNTWGDYFLMERTIAAATPVAGVLLGLTLLGGLATAVRAR